MIDKFGIHKVYQAPRGSGIEDEYAITFDGERVGTLLHATGRHGGPWRVFVGWGDHKHPVGRHYGQGTPGALRMVAKYFDIKVNA
jgi:hypothetical protein